MLSTSITLPVMPRKPVPTSEKRAAVGGRIRPSLIEALQELAAADRRTFSFMLEEAVREYVERHAKAGGKASGKPKA